LSAQRGTVQWGIKDDYDNNSMYFTLTLIHDVTGLVAALGSGNVSVTFELE
jgi:hypothetical protein